MCCCKYSIELFTNLIWIWSSFWSTFDQCCLYHYTLEHHHLLARIMKTWQEVFLPDFLLQECRMRFILDQRMWNRFCWKMPMSLGMESKPGDNFLSLQCTILEPVKIGKVSTKTYVVKTVPASYTLPLQTVPDPYSFPMPLIIYVHSREICSIFKAEEGRFVITPFFLYQCWHHLSPSLTICVHKENSSFS